MKSIVTALAMVLAGTIVAVDKPALLTSESIKGGWGAVKVEFTDADGSKGIKALSTAGEKKQAAALSSKDAVVKPGDKLQVSFKARGDVNLQGMFLLNINGKNVRKDFTASTKLTADWQPVTATLTVPDGAEKLSISLFCWQQDGWFEVKDFTLTAE